MPQSHFSTIPNDFSFTLHSVFGKKSDQDGQGGILQREKIHIVSSAQQTGNEFAD